jgi:hypothetical protein
MLVRIEHVSSIRHCTPRNPKSATAAAEALRGNAVRTTSTAL